MFTTKENGDFEFSNARRNIWGTVDVDVTIAKTGKAVRFTANPDDSEDYGRQLYDQLNTTYSSEVAECPESERYEAFAGMVRADRNNLLKGTDWTQNSDVPEATRTLWAPYRQALRDVPSQAGFPYNISWPSLPS